MSKDFNPDADDQLPEKKSSQQLLLLLLLLLILVFAYLYFFTGLIKPRGEEAPKPQPVAEAPVKKPLPPRPEAKAGDAAKPAAAAKVGMGYMVQVAAVSKREDAELLKTALEAKSYPVVITSAASDKLFHVQVGPSSDIKEAETWRAKLIADGYNPLLKK